MKQIVIVLATFSTAISLLISDPTAAQTAPAQPPVPSQRSDDTLSGISISLDVSESESQAAVSIGRFFNQTSLEAKSEPGHRTAYGWKLALDVPIGGGDNVLESATLDKLGDGTKLSGSLTFLSYNSDPARIGSKEYIALMDQAKAACEAQEAAQPSGASCAYFGPSPSYVLKHNPGARLAMNRVMFDGYWSGGVKGSVALHRYDWVDSGTLAKNSARPTGYSLAAWAVYYPKDAVSAFKLEAEYSSAAEAADAEIVCKTVIVTPTTDCVSGSPTAPVRKQTLVGRAEYRRYFPFSNDNGGIGVALNGNVDAATGDYGFEVPIYLTLPGVTSIMPGLKFGYASKKDDFTVALFLKSSFSF